MRVRTDHHTAGKSVVLKHYLMDNAGSRFPKADTVLVGNGFQEIVDFAVALRSRCNICLSPHIRLDQVIAVHGGGNGRFGFSCVHELKQRHLCGRILHRDTIGTEIHIIFTTAERMDVRFVVQMCI